jgi:hypothetical protein
LELRVGMAGVAHHQRARPQTAQRGREHPLRR